MTHEGYQKETVHVLWSCDETKSNLATTGKIEGKIEVDAEKIA